MYCSFKTGLLWYCCGTALDYACVFFTLDLWCILSIVVELWCALALCSVYFLVDADAGAGVKWLPWCSGLFVTCG